MSSVIRAAAERERFGATGEGIVWALIDSGIDGSHPHFQRYENLVLEPPLRHRDLTAPDLDESDQALEALVDAFSHGTHIAGLIAGEATASPGVVLEVDQPRFGATSVAAIGSTLDTVTGMALRCKLLSLKVLDDDGQGKASLLVEALQWIRAVNAQSGTIKIHGVTLAVSFAYDPELFACGLSPLCVEVNELVKSGVVVVAAAGNAGFAHVNALTGVIQAGAVMSITDPGNAEFAITVGSTHSDARAHGVSYFSSKGPTADGRHKPDLVAPGERMLSCVPSRRSPDDTPTPSARVARYAESTGGSAAVAVASGAIAALLSARPDLIGRPFDVKRLLTQTAQDLQRDRYAQGHGAIDLMRALEESAPKKGAVWAPGSGAREFDLTVPSQAVPAVHPSSAAEVRGSSATAVPGDQKKRFAVALSYPGERRGYVQKVVAELRRTFSRAEIFYDRFHQAELVGPDLDVRLERIYHDDSELIAVFISGEYAAKEWTGLEWRIVRDVIKRRRAEDVVPLRFDDTPIPGLLSIDAFVDLKDFDPEFAAALIVERINLNRAKRNASV
jgi:serine protease AprX